MKPDLFRYEPYWKSWIFSLNQEIYRLKDEPFGETAHKVVRQTHPDNGLSIPYRVQIQTTNRCNFACPHCYVSSGLPLPSEMTYEQIERLLYQLQEWGVLQVTWSGGEAFARKGFLDLVRLSDSLGIENSVLTNGYAFGKLKSIDLFEMWSLFCNIQISIDGWGEMFDKFVDLKGAFPFVIQAINSLYDSKPMERRLKVATTVSDDFTSYEEIAKFLHGRDITWRIAKQVLNGRSKHEGEVVEQRLAMSHTILQNIRRHYNVQVIHPYDKSVPKDGSIPCEWYVEPGARWYLYIKANGDVYPFPYLDGIDDLYAGNVLTSDLNNIWLSNAFNGYRNLTKENTGCSGCPLICQMWTRSFNMNGSIHATPPVHPGCSKLVHF